VRYADPAPAPDPVDEFDPFAADDDDSDDDEADADDD